MVYCSWLVRLNNAFLWFMYVAVLFQIMCTWFPEVGGWRTTVHRVLTGISGPPCPALVMLATAANLSIVVRFSAWGILAFWFSAGNRT